MGFGSVTKLPDRRIVPELDPVNVTDGETNLTGTSKAWETSRFWAIVDEQVVRQIGIV